jgi:dihydrodiol dehydrogenase / D-xylose 1-dehydrogenase (NADP)
VVNKAFPVSWVPNKEYNFPNWIGMTYEAKHVRECLQKDLKESPVSPLAESELLADILEEVKTIEVKTKIKASPQ